jgi:glucokinase
LKAAAVVALDVGGTSIKAAVVDGAGRVLRHTARPTPVREGPDAVVSAIVATARELAGPGVAAVGAVVPGVVDAEAGIAGYAANLGWRDVALREVLAAQLQLPVAIENDVRAAGLAEQRLGRAGGATDCLVVVIGTGIAAAATSAGRPVLGARGLAGEVGHLPVRPDGEPCACGQRGCTEVYASAAGIARRYAAHTGTQRTAEQIVGRLGSDRDAAQIWAEAVAALGLALASCTLLSDPSLIVIAGGLARAGGLLGEPVAAALRARLAWRPAPEVEISPLAERAGLYGAALLAWRACGRDPGPWAPARPLG